MTRALVLDANILIRAVLGQQVRKLILQYAASVSFVAPVHAYDEARKHLPSILARRANWTSPSRWKYSHGWKSWYSP